MRPSKARFITACQQMLAIGAALAVLGPAADVITLDVVTNPGSAAERILGDGSATEVANPQSRVPARETSRVETEAVDPLVNAVPLEPAAPGSVDEEATDAGAGVPRAKRGEQEFVTEPKSVDGYGAIGVTWEGDAVEEDQITVYARTQTGGEWSDWTELEYHDDHGPDPESAEGRNARPGTEPLIIGDVDAVQTKVISADGARTDDLEMAVVAPGESTATAEEAPAIDTGAGDAPAGDAGNLETDQGDIALQAGSYTRKPTIYSRAQWGADERLRDSSSLRYGEVHAGFVHHTVNANDYTREQVPGIIRSIYAYHTRSKGWSDIGYNYLLDRFGRIWEGRYGGVDRPVVGAHTLGYNDWSFAGSAIGNFETVQPTNALLNAYGRLFAWKLSLHGVDASSTQQQVGSKTFPAINGHRDAGSTACPGRYLYAKLPTVRSLAATTQADWSGRDKVTDLAGNGHPDIVVRRTSDGRAFVIPTGGMLQFASARTLSSNWSRFDLKFLSPDLTGDGIPDMVIRTPAGSAGVRPGNGAGGFAGRVKAVNNLKGFDLVTPVGRFDADNHNDLIGRHTSTGRLYLFSGDGAGGFARTWLAHGFADVNLLTSSGDVTGDGIGDLLARHADGTLMLHPGDGTGRFGTARTVPGTWKYPMLTGFGDFTGDGRNDLVLRNSRGAVFVAPGTGKGTFSGKIGPLTGGFGGINGFSGGQVVDGADPDLIGFAGDSLVVVPHTGKQNILPRLNAASTFSDTNLVLNVGDWDRDGFGDLVTRASSTGQLLLRRGDGSGRFAAPIVIATANFNKVALLSAVGDTTGDGWPDLMGQPVGGSMRIYPGKGSGGLRPSYVSHSALSADRQLGLGRWNADGAPDNAFKSGSRLYWMRGNGPGGLFGGSTTFNVDLSAYDWVLAPGDVNGNGRPDLIVRDSAGRLWVLPGTATGFSARRFLGAGFRGYDLVG